MSETGEEKPKRGVKERLFSALNHNWSVTVLGGLLLALLTPLVTGFANLTYSTKSWDYFGVANEAEVPGAYLSEDAVYRLPIGERFRVDGDMLLSLSQNYDGLYGVLSRSDGSVERTKLGVQSTLVFEGNCEVVVVNLMRLVKRDDSHAYVMYRTSDSKDEACRGFFW